MVVVLCTAATSYSVLQSLVVPALGTFQRQLGTTASGAAWLLTAYLLSASVLTPVIGRLGDLYGKRRALVWSLVILAAGAALSAVAPNLPVMLAGRLIQGAGGAVFPLLFAAWLTTLLLAVTEIPAGRPAVVLALAGVTLPVAAGWVVWELRTARPMIDLRTLWRPDMRDTNLATLLLGFGMFAAWMIVPLLVQQDPRTRVGFGAPAAAVGLYLLPTAVGTLAVTPLVGRIAEASGPRSALFLGGLATAVSYGWMAVAHGSRVSLLLALLLEGAGIGLAFAAVAVRTVRSVPADQTGVATGVNTIMRTVGGTLGTNLAGTLLAATATATGQPAPAAYTVCFAVFGVSLLAVAVIGWRSGSARPVLGEQLEGAHPVGVVVGDGGDQQLVGAGDPP